MRFMKRWKHTIRFALIAVPLLALAIWWQVALIKSVLFDG
jgi:hypothetical protein